MENHKTKILQQKESEHESTKGWEERCSVRGEGSGGHMRPLLISHDVNHMLRIEHMAQSAVSRWVSPTDSASRDVRSSKTMSKEIQPHPPPGRGGDHG